MNDFQYIFIYFCMINNFGSVESPLDIQWGKKAVENHWSTVYNLKVIVPIRESIHIKNVFLIRLIIVEILQKSDLTLFCVHTSMFWYCIDFTLVSSRHSDCANMHTGPVWQLRWIDHESGLGGEDKGEILISVSADGRISKWYQYKSLECVGKWDRHDTHLCRATDQRYSVTTLALQSIWTLEGIVHPPKK